MFGKGAGVALTAVSLAATVSAMTTVPAQAVTGPMRALIEPRTSSVFYTEGWPYFDGTQERTVTVYADVRGCTPGGSFDASFDMMQDGYALYGPLNPGSSDRVCGADGTARLATSFQALDGSSRPHPGRAFVTLTWVGGQGSSAGGSTSRWVTIPR